MTGTCFYHADQPALANCVQCGVPICAECRETVREKPVCKKCVGAIRARVASEMSGGPAAGFAAPPTAAALAARPAERPSPTQMLLGIGLGLLIGCVGTLIWEKIYFYGHFSLSLIYLAIGYGVGFGLMKGTGQGGFGTAVLAALITVVALTFGHAVYANDVLGELATERGVPKPFLTWHIFTLIVSHLGAMHWICVALGMYGAFKATEQTGGG